MTTNQKLSKAIRSYKEHNEDCFNPFGIEEPVNAFIALYSMLGEEELHDGIATAMQDEGYEETYEDIMFYFGELS